MDGNAFDRLTERQKQCLRLVASGKRSKTIGALIGISHLTVNQHVEAAKAKLGAPSRESAAAMLVAYEQGLYPEQLTSDPAGLAGPYHSANIGAPPTSKETSPSWRAPEFVREEQAPYRATAFATDDLLRLPLRTAERPRNDLSRLDTLVAIVKLVLLLAIGGGAAASIVETVTQSAYQPH